MESVPHFSLKTVQSFSDLNNIYTTSSSVPRIPSPCISIASSDHNIYTTSSSNQTIVVSQPSPRLNQFSLKQIEMKPETMQPNVSITTVSDAVQGDNFSDMSDDDGPGPSQAPIGDFSFSEKSIVEMNKQQFNEVIQGIPEIQCILLRDMRRRGLTRKAVQKCRQRQNMRLNELDRRKRELQEKLRETLEVNSSHLIHDRLLKFFVNYLQHRCQHLTLEETMSLEYRHYRTRYDNLQKCIIKHLQDNTGGVDVPTNETKPS